VYFISDGVVKGSGVGAEQGLKGKKGTNFGDKPLNNETTKKGKRQRAVEDGKFEGVNDITNPLKVTSGVISRDT
jgi:hypothetical protein